MQEGGCGQSTFKDELMEKTWGESQENLSRYDGKHVCLQHCKRTTLKIIFFLRGRGTETEEVT